MEQVTKVAQWFINKGVLDYKEKGGEYLTPLKLQKLLYYAQGAHLAMRGERLFNEKIFAWSHGPVVREIYAKYKDIGGGPLDKFHDVDFSNETLGVLEEVYDVFGQYSAWKLREMTHDETPWKSTEINHEIPVELIQEYFVQNYLD